MYYDSLQIYIESQTSLLAKIAAIDASITALQGSLLNGCVNADLQEYNFNDGQTIVRTIYRDVDKVINALKGLEYMRTIYQNKINGYCARATDAKNLFPYRYNKC